jgi:C1A family cysteine protease
MFAATVIAATMATSSATLFSSNVEHQKFMWSQYKQEYAKEYTSSEETTRFSHFVDNLKIIDERNKAENGSAFHGLTKFSDMSQEEFASKYLNAKPNPNRASFKVAEITTAPKGTEVVDWSGVLTTPVKDQGYCGSCWAFSATEQIESDAMRTLGKTWLLSAEQITQCDKTSFGCGGGWTEHAYDYVKKEGGLEQESDYPYTSSQGVTGTCHSDAKKEVVGVSGYTTINGESQMASYVESTGPLSVCLDANSWNSYRGGIMTQCGKQVDHCVQAVGVKASSDGYWKVRNSWGTSWGEDGYIRLAYGANTCAITSDPTYVDVFAK